VVKAPRAAAVATRILQIAELHQGQIFSVSVRPRRKMFAPYKQRRKRRKRFESDALHLPLGGNHNQHSDLPGYRCQFGTLQQVGRINS